MFPRDAVLGIWPERDVNCLKKTDARFLLQSTLFASQRVCLIANLIAIEIRVRPFCSSES